MSSLLTKTHNKLDNLSLTGLSSLVQQERIHKTCFFRILVFTKHPQKELSRVLIEKRKKLILKFLTYFFIYFPKNIFEKDL
jgi:hypothetical protein